MNSSMEFQFVCKKAIVDYVNARLEKTDGNKIDEENVYVVWYSKALQNHKGLFSTTLPDGMYYECTYNGDKSELYLDAYKKWENICIPIK